MPLVTVDLFDWRLNPESEARIIAAMTDALCEAIDAEELREHTWVIVQRDAARRRDEIRAPSPQRVVGTWIKRHVETV